MRQTTQQVIDKLVIEKQELTGKIIALENFLTCPDFVKISVDQMKLLEEQHAAMINYKNILIKRIFNLRVHLLEELKNRGDPEPQKEAPGVLYTNKTYAAPEETQDHTQQSLYGSHCKECDSYIGDGKCHGGITGWTDHTGAMICFQQKRGDENGTQSNK